jgi:hypothetical protein
MNRIDTQVGRITQTGANLFSELDFTDEEAKRYHAESQTLIKRSLAECIEGSKRL